jgi:hypothetical protein
MHILIIIAIIIVIIALLIGGLFMFKVCAIGYYFTNHNNENVRFPKEGGVLIGTSKDGKTQFMHPIRAEFEDDGIYYWPEYEDNMIIVKASLDDKLGEYVIRLVTVDNMKSTVSSNATEIIILESVLSDNNSGWDRHMMLIY